MPFYLSSTSFAGFAADYLRVLLTNQNQLIEIQELKSIITDLRQDETYKKEKEQELQLRIDLLENENLYMLLAMNTRC